MKLRVVFLQCLSSLKVTLVCLCLAAILIFVETIYQVEYGNYLAQHKILKSFIVTWHPSGLSFAIPIFVGGYAVALLFLLNLLAALFTRINYTIQNLGIIFIHVSLIFLFAGAILSSLFSTESVLPLKMQEIKGYSLEVRKTELAVSLPELEEEIIFSEEQLAAGNLLHHQALPFRLYIRKLLLNATLSHDNASFIEIPPTFKDNELNYPAASVEIRDDRNGIKTMALSTFVEEEQPFNYLDKAYQLALRPKTHKFPFRIQLLKMFHEKHAGTSIPKHIASLVALYSEKGVFERQALITLNHPLRYKGRTFYQTGLVEDNAGDNTSIFQVVENPLWVIPYLFVGLIFMGLVYQLWFRFYTEKD